MECGRLTFYKSIKLMNAQIYSFDPACQTECDRDEIFFGKADGLVQRRKTLFFVQSEGKSSMGRPERSAAKSKGDEVGATASAGGTHFLPWKGIAWILYFMLELN